MMAVGLNFAQATTSRDQEDVSVHSSNIQVLQEEKPKPLDYIIKDNKRVKIKQEDNPEPYDPMMDLCSKLALDSGSTFNLTGNMEILEPNSLGQLQPAFVYKSNTGQSTIYQEGRARGINVRMKHDPKPLPMLLWWHLW